MSPETSTSPRRRRGLLVVLVLVIAATAAGGFLLFGSADVTVDEARAAIDDLPYRITLHEVDGESLVGHARGGHGAVVWFAAVPELDAPSVPAALRRIDRNVTGGGGWWVYDDSEVERRRETPARRRERGAIEVAIEEALCRADTGEPCPV